MTDVSQLSVVKFAQKVGYKGFTALKLALSEALVNRQEPPSIPVHNKILSEDPINTVGETTPGGKSCGSARHAGYQ